MFFIFLFNNTKKTINNKLITDKNIMIVSKEESAILSKKVILEPNDCIYKQVLKHLFRKISLKVGVFSN